MSKTKKREEWKRKTNIEIVNDIMNFSRYGALAQVFVMDALLKMSEAVAKSTPKDYPKNNFIHPEAWIGVAKEIKAKLEIED
jgi:hypothetical protein